ncbi:L-arabinose isomerase [Virgibacillus halotolerans]|uniref:hypothetical protein n=1 Tax=Virgibacillus halotolerans TaxID=1071053 RepID=UPI00195F5DF1|nr:hypothetical protein [Virgibacillus halotolerans]MBM7600070.1 L-arabinose isomerase [Virgibacillus halotolerans]
MLHLARQHNKEVPWSIIDGIGDKEDPARLVFDAVAREGVMVSVVDLGTHYHPLVNAIKAVSSKNETHHLPVANVMWEPKPNSKEGIKSWIESGGGHDTVLLLNLSVEQITDWDKMVDLETIVVQ